MAKSANQKLRLLYLRQLLLQKTDEEHPMSTQEIIDELSSCGISVERKTVYDDLASLEAFGMDITKIKGASTGYFVGERSFELPELKLLVDLVGASRFITYKKSRELIGKLEKLASINQARLLQRQVHVSDRVKTMNESIYYNVDMIYNGIEQNKKISFQYFEYTINCDASRYTATKEIKLKKNGEPYVISPFILSWSESNYYLVGYDEKSGIMKHYRVDKMKNITVTGEDRTGGSEFSKLDMSLYSNKLFGMFGGKEEHIKLAFKNELAGVVIDRFGNDITMKYFDDESFFIDIGLVVSPQFFGWLAGLAGKAKIVSPEYVAQSYKAQLRLACEA